MILKIGVLQKGSVFETCIKKPCSFSSQKTYQRTFTCNDASSLVNLTIMLDCEVKNGWDQFIEFIESRSSKAEFLNWIAPIRLIEALTDKTVLEVPNVYVQDYLLDNFSDVLGNFLPLLPSGEPAIQFIIPDEEPPKQQPISKQTKEEEPENINHDLCLNRLYTFENFIEGPSNQFVKSAAFGVASRPGKSYNPLFIHGGVGLGKTHLLHSIGHYIYEHHKKKRIQVITTEAFINDIVDHLRNKSIDKLKRYYRTLDVLLVDDIQFLQNQHLLPPGQKS